MTLGNGLKEYRSFYARTGRLNTLLTEPTGGGTDVQNLTLTYDEVGNLKTRDDGVIGIGEDFTYDSLNRLTYSVADSQTGVTIGYSAAGRITSKSDVCGSAWSYGAGSAGPHAVTSACGTSYGYDANGRMVTRGSGEIDWYSYDLPSRIDNLADTSYSQFWYGPDRSRYKQYQSDTGATITYVGALFEYEDTASTDTARYYVHTGTRAIAMVERVGGSNTTGYLHRDHQGSVTKLTSSGGSVTQSLAFDAWGLRRNASDWSPLGSPFSGSHETERGYTGHEHLDTVGLIHMNGRVQDPILGRFVSADPFVQAPYLTQSHNRYSYVMNNPASLVDPSGFLCTSAQMDAGTCETGDGPPPTISSGPPDIFCEDLCGVDRARARDDQWYEDVLNGAGTTLAGRMPVGNVPNTAGHYPNEPLVRFRDNFAGNTLLELDKAAGYGWYGLKKAYAWVTGSSTELLYPTGILSGESVRHGERSRIVGEVALTAVFGGSNRLLSGVGRAASVDDLIGMMNRRPGTTAEFATGDADEYLRTLSAEGSHTLLEGGTSHILLRSDVATRRTALHEWLHRRLQRQTGGPRPGEDALIENFLERHSDFFRLGD